MLTLDHAGCAGALTSLGAAFSSKGRCFKQGTVKVPLHAEAEKSETESLPL